MLQPTTELSAVRLYPPRPPRNVDICACKNACMCVRAGHGRRPAGVGLGPGAARRTVSGAGRPGPPALLTAECAPPDGPADSCTLSLPRNAMCNMPSILFVLSILRDLDRYGFPCTYAYRRHNCF